jgi:hypothetical protein
MNPEHKYPSPDGRFVFHIFPWEARMSLWIETPNLVEVASGERLVRFKDSNWSLDGATWLDSGRVTMTLRKYPGDHTPGNFEVTVDCAARTAAVAGRMVPLTAVERELQKLYAAARPLDPRLQKLRSLLHRLLPGCGSSRG